MKREKIRAVMILNEVEVDIARIVKFDPDFNNLKEKIAEVRDIILQEEFPQTLQTAPELDWDKMKEIY
jgi:hypothetical protein